MNQKGFLIPNLNLYLGIAAAVVILGGAAAIKFKFDTLQRDNAELTQKVTVLSAENATLTETNKQNAAVIEQMKVDKAKIDKALSDLRIQKSRDSAELSGLRHTIQNLIKVDPAANGPVSPVLKQTINKLQESRKPAPKGEKTN